MAEAVQAALAEPPLRDRLRALGMVARGEPPAAFDAVLRRDIEEWREVVARANIRAE
jgi:tripartite-type tricarboxylate transporter receptor subunit TctC